MKKLLYGFVALIALGMNSMNIDAMQKGPVMQYHAHTMADFKKIDGMLRLLEMLRKDNLLSQKKYEQLQDSKLKDLYDSLKTCKKLNESTLSPSCFHLLSMQTKKVIAKEVRSFLKNTNLWQKYLRNDQIIKLKDNNELITLENSVIKKDVFEDQSMIFECNTFTSPRRGSIDSVTSVASEVYDEDIITEEELFGRNIIIKKKKSPRNDNSTQDTRPLPLEIGSVTTEMQGGNFIRSPRSPRFISPRETATEFKSGSGFLETVFDENDNDLDLLKNVLVMFKKNPRLSETCSHIIAHRLRDFYNYLNNHECYILVQAIDVVYRKNLQAVANTLEDERKLIMCIVNFTKNDTNRYEPLLIVLDELKKRLKEFILTELQNTFAIQDLGELESKHKIQKIKDLGEYLDVEVFAALKKIFNMILTCDNIKIRQHDFHAYLDKYKLYGVIEILYVDFLSGLNHYNDEVADKLMGYIIDFTPEDK